MRAPRPLKRWPAWVLLVLVVVGFLAVGADPRQRPEHAATSGPRRSSSGVACPVCDGESVFESRNKASENLRTQIRALVDEGELQRRRDHRHDRARATAPACLLVPRASGFDALVWALPAAALVCAVAGLAVAFRRWRREAADDADPTDDDRELVAAALASEDDGLPRSETGERRPARRARGRAAVPAAVAARPRRRARRRRRRRRRLRHAARRLHQAGRRRPAQHRGGQGGAAGQAAAPLGSHGGGRRRVVLAVAVGLGVVAARSSGERTAGDEITGGIPGREDTATLLARRPVAPRSDPRLAQDAYAQVLDREPDNPEALTYSGWLLYVASAGASAELRDAAVSTAKHQLARAVAADPTYPDPHCFLAVIAADADGDTATAQAEADACLALDPPAEVRELVEGFTATLGSTVPG